MNFKIEQLKTGQINEILVVWEKSVLATHHFLAPHDFSEIKDMLQDYDFETLDVYCLTEHDKVIGFIAVAHAKIEMLFLDPAYFGKGLGYQLLAYAVSSLKANLVDVNEQNNKAKNFYEKFGFKVYERTDKDDFGKNYPLLRMRLKAVDHS